jgi:hypothetical protein
MLETWAAAVEKGRLSTIEGLIRNTYDETGANSVRVEEHLRLEVIFPFWEVMDAELQRMAKMRSADLDLPKDQRNSTLHLQMILLERIVEKVRETHMSSTYSPAKDSR